MTIPDQKYVGTSDHVRQEIERAKRLGTYGQIDRSKQYEGRYSPEMLLRSQDSLWRHQRDRDGRRFRDAVILLILSALLARAPEIWAWIARLTR